MNVSPRGDRGVVASLACALANDDWALQKAVATSMGMVAQVGDMEALEALLPLLHDADWRVRKTALQAIGRVALRGCRRALDCILLLLDDTCVAALGPIPSTRASLEFST